MEVQQAMASPAQHALPVRTPPPQARTPATFVWQDMQVLAAEHAPMRPMQPATLPRVVQGTARHVPRATTLQEPPRDCPVTAAVSSEFWLPIALHDMHAPVYTYRVWDRSSLKQPPLHIALL